MDRDKVARPITVAIIEDHPVAVDGLRAWIDRDPARRAKVIASGPTIESVLDGQGANADVLLLDLELGDELVTDRITRLCANGHRVVVFSAHDDTETVRSVYEAGASNFLSKEDGRDHCVETILAAGTDRPYVTPTDAGAILADDRPHLSDQERTALRLWLQSMSKASVARRMKISEATVKQYIDRARIKYARIGRPAPTKEALLARAIEDGLIRLEEIGEYRSHAVRPHEDTL